MSEPINARIDRMFARDRFMAWLSVVLLWLTIAVVYFAVDNVLDDTRIRVALAIAAIALLVFNTASIFAMVRHYQQDKAHIYGLDIRHLDENRAARGE